MFLNNNIMKCAVKLLSSMLVLSMFVCSQAFSQTFTLSNPADASGQIQALGGFRNDTNVPLYAFVITATGGSASLTNLTFTPGGTFAASDITNYKLWWSVNNSFASATNIGTATTISNTGVAQSFTAFSKTLEVNNGGKNYFWITMDISATAVCNRTVSVGALASGAMTTGATKAGSTSAGNAQTFKPRITSAPTNSIKTGVAQNYTMTGGTSYSWSRAAVTGISNAAVSGQTSNPITETLVNTSTTSVLVKYVITPTEAGCAGVPFNYEVVVSPTNTVACTAVPDAFTPPACGTLQNLTSGGASSLVANVSYGFCGASFSTNNIDNGTSTTPIYVLAGQTLTINGNLNTAGNVYVMLGGTLILTGDFNTSSGNLYVYGTLNHAVGGTAKVQGNPSTIYIAKGATYNAGNLQMNSSGTIVNEGTMNINQLEQFSGSAKMCLHNSGCVKTPTIGTVDATNIITFGGSVGYVYYSGTTCPTHNKNLTTSSDMKICASITQATANASGGAGNPCNGKFGAAQVKYGCTPASADCPGAIALPITLAFFKPTLTNEGVIVKWGTNSQWDSEYFVIEKSKNGIDWEYVSTLPSENGKYRYREFSVTDSNPYEGDSYYRLVEVDNNGTRTVYATDFVHNDKSFAGFSIYPNPSTGSFVVAISGDSPQYQLSLFDVLGQNIGVYTLLAGKNEISTALSAGIYLAKLKVGHDYFTQTIVVQ